MFDNKEEKVVKPVPATNSAVLKFFANLVSYIFHPVFMPLILTYALYILVPSSFAGFNEKQIQLFIVRIGVIAVFFPLLTTFLCQRLGFIKSIQMYDPKDRIIPLIGVMIFYFWVYWVHKNIESPYILRVLFLGTFWGVIVLFMLNIFFKISMHTMAAGGVLGLMIVLLISSPVSMAIPFFGTIIIAGLIGTSRLLLGAHKPGEIWAGYIFGVIVQLAAYVYLS